MHYQYYCFHRFHLASSGLSNERSGDVIFTTRKELAGAQVFVCGCMHMGIDTNSRYTFEMESIFNLQVDQQRRNSVLQCHILQSSTCVVTDTVDCMQNSSLAHLRLSLLLYPLLNVSIYF